MEAELGILWVAFVTCLLSFVATALVFLYKYIENYIYSKDDEPKDKTTSGSKKSSKKKHKGSDGKPGQGSMSPPEFITRLTVISRLLLHLTTVLVSLSLLLLVYYFLSSNMDIDYVLRHSHEDYQWYYKLVGVWSSQKGAQLLWLCLAALVVSGEEAHRLRSFRKQEEKKGKKDSGDAPETSLLQTPDPEHYALSKLVMLLFLLGFIYLVIQQNPFERAGNVDPQFREGLGIDFSLRTPLMIFHPPVEFIAYALVLVPFASSISYLVTGNKEALATSYFWARLAWLFFTMGLCFGAIWAYVVLDWGGYWGWDPVEVGNLVPWLVATVFVHAMVSFKRKDEFRSFLPLLGILVFTTTLLATFITGSGFWTSQHAYTVSRDAAGKFIRILEESDSSRYFFKVILLSLILGESLYLNKLFYHRFPEFRERLEERGLREQMRKKLAARREKTWKQSGLHWQVLGLLVFGWECLKIYVDNYRTILRKFSREKGAWSVFPVYFSLVLMVLFLVALLNVVWFMELAFVASNIALSVELGIAVLVLLFLLLPLSWKIMMEEESELKLELGVPSARTLMTITIALLFIITVFTTLVLLRSVNATNAEVYESRFPFFVLPLIILLVFCSAQGMLSFKQLLFPVIIVFFLSLVLSLALGTELWLYLPLLGLGGSLSFAGAVNLREWWLKDVECQRGIFHIVGFLQMTIGILGLIFWSSGFSELCYGFSSNFIDNSLLLIVGGLAGAMILLVCGRLLFEYAKELKESKNHDSSVFKYMYIVALVIIFTIPYSFFFATGLFSMLVTPVFIFAGIVFGYSCLGSRSPKGQSQEGVKRKNKITSVQDSSPRLFGKTRRCIFHSASHIIHLGLVLILLGYVTTQEYHTTGQFEDVGANQGWNFEGYGFFIEEVEIEEGAGGVVEKATIKVDIYDGELDMDVFSQAGNQTRSRAHEGLERTGTIIIEIEHDFEWIVRTENILHANGSTVVDPETGKNRTQRVLVPETSYKQHITVTRVMVRDYHFRLTGFKTNDSGTIRDMGKNDTWYGDQSPLHSISFELRLIRGTLLLWSGSGLMMAGVGLRTVCEKRKD